jgi:hypothetical protein
MPSRIRFLSTTMLSGVVGAALAGPTVANAADLVLKAPALTKSLEAPAVDGFNGKVEALGGGLNRNSVYGLAGSFSVPLASQWGMQVDTAFGSLEGHTFGSVAPHFFWRDPARGLIGLYASHTFWNQFGGVYVTQVAGEGEYYFGRFTVQGIAGVEFGNSAGSASSNTSIIAPGGIGGGSPPGVITTTTFNQGFDVKTRFMDQVNLKYYFLDNWDGYVGHRYLGGDHALALGTEAAMPLGQGTMVSAFGEARIGERGFDGIWGGLRLYFGNHDKTLIRRHREDDPNTWDTLHSILNNQTSSSSSSSTLFCTPPGSLTPGGTCEIGGGISDIRLKRDIVFIERMANGLGLYRYRYLWSEETYVGVMAQEVAETRPDAVMTGPDGYMRVLYRKLGLKLMTLDEWEAAADVAVAA